MGTAWHTTNCHWKTVDPSSVAWEHVVLSAWAQQKETIRIRVLATWWHVCTSAYQILVDMAMTQFQLIHHEIFLQMRKFMSLLSKVLLLTESPGKLNLCKGGHCDNWSTTNCNYSWISSRWTGTDLQEWETTVVLDACELLCLQILLQYLVILRAIPRQRHMKYRTHLIP